METITILVYVDSSIFTDQAGSLFGGLSDLVRFSKEKTKHLANVEFHFLQRHEKDDLGNEINGANRLTADLLKPYDEVWFFGLRQVNTERQPHNELEDDEVESLTDWMNLGGVFLTGDHSKPDPTIETSTCAELGHASFLGLGRALGFRIPRAGQMRVWHGPPTGCTDGELRDLDNFNTSEGEDPCLLDDPLLQFDEKPQIFGSFDKGVHTSPAVLVCRIKMALQTTS